MCIFLVFSYLNLVKLGFQIFVELSVVSSFLVLFKYAKEEDDYMYNTSKIPSKIIEAELSIKLLEYLKRNNAIDDGMYSYVVNKLIRKIEIEKNKIDDNYIKNKIEEIKQVLEKYNLDSSCYSDLFNELVDRVYVYKEEDKIIKLDIFIKTGECIKSFSNELGKKFHLMDNHILLSNKRYTYYN